MKWKVKATCGAELVIEVIEPDMDIHGTFWMMGVPTRSIEWIEKDDDS